MLYHLVNWFVILKFIGSCIRFSSMSWILLFNFLIQDSANVIRDKYGVLNLLINTSGVLSIPNVLHPGTDFFPFTKVDTFLSLSRFLCYLCEVICPIFSNFQYRNYTEQSAKIFVASCLWDQCCWSYFGLQGVFYWMSI